jgi:hypothetical protein
MPLRDQPTLRRSDLYAPNDAGDDRLAGTKWKTSSATTDRRPALESRGNSTNPSEPAFPSGASYEPGSLSFQSDDRPYDQNLEESFFDGPPHEELIPTGRRLGGSRRPGAYEEDPAVVLAVQPEELAAQLCDDLVAEGAIIVEESEQTVRAIIPPAVAPWRGLRWIRSITASRPSNETVSIQLRPCRHGTTAFVSGAGDRLRSVVMASLGIDTGPGHASGRAHFE